MSVVLITGAGSGFGKVTALAFARQGDTVYASMRNPDDNCSLARTAADENLSIKLLKLDVTDKSSIQKAVDVIFQNEGCLDVLINNAGIHIPGALEDMPDSDIHRVMNTNFFGVLNVTRTVLPIMRKQQSGRIIMVSSIGAMIGRANDSIYCASKSALEAAAEALRYEVARFGISVSVIEPGVFQTEIGRKYDVSSEYPQDSPYRQLVDYRVNLVKKSCQTGDDPQRIAELIVSIAAHEQPGFRYPAGNQAEEFLPMLKKMTESERDEFIRKAAKIDWWLDGEPEPEKE
ncbi:MAG: SDR family oxidoreductase [Gammaproteobacteria bacterium]|jgi:NAD(P)-dependent dehydrogenase (short-subunit alcohol dehydrogenase family)|nr:SDR family oxidoreductase [Gammaproteobacteria bacterium]